MQVQLIQEVPAASAPWPAGWHSVLMHTHTDSGRSDHGGPVQPPESYRQLAAWARRCGIDAIGMGSPYTPHSAVNYGRYDGCEGDRYYRADFDRLSVLDAEDIEAMLVQANRVAEGQTFFYLDNETPKGRYGHMWWLGYYYDLPAWHDYDRPFDRWMLAQSPETDGCEEPMPYERRDRAADEVAEDHRDELAVLAQAAVRGGLLAALRCRGVQVGRVWRSSCAA